MNALKRALADLQPARRSPPLFGQVSLWILLALAFHLGHQIQDAMQFVYTGIPVGSVSIAGLLPASIRTNPQSLALLWAVFSVCAALWAFNWALPFASWGATISYTLYVSLYLENVPQWDHKYHLTNLVLFVYCAWYHLYWRDIRRAVRGKKFWSTPLYPRWVYLASMYAIACHYFLAGVSKLIWGQGFLWADGLTLQLWVLARGQGGSPLGSIIVAHRTLTMLMQIGALGFELTMPLALFFPLYRVAAAMFVLGFHIANVYIFPDVVFIENIVVVWMFFIAYPLVERFTSRARTP